MNPSIIKLTNEKLIRRALSIELSGRLACSANNLIYLNVDDAFIHLLFPLLQNKQIKKPNYFGKGLAGAHVSVVYPEENVSFDKKDLGEKYYFKIKGLIMAEMNFKKYYALLIDCPELQQLRNKYGLPDELNFKNYWIALHITIGVSDKK